MCPIQLLNSLIQTYLFYFWTVYADHLRFISLFLPCETESQWFSRTWRQYSLPLAYNLPLPLVCNFGHTWLLTEGSRTKKYIFEPTLPDTTFESAVFPPILFTTVTGKEQGFLGLGLNDTHEKNRREACRNWVISWLEIFRAVPALNDAVSRLLPSDLERSTGDRSRCCRCSRCGGLSTCTWVTPRKGCLHHQRGCYSVQPPIQVLIWKLVLQSGRSWLMGDPLLPSGNSLVLLNSRTPNPSGLANEGDASTEDVLSTHRLLFQWGKGGSCQILPPLGRNGTFFLIFPLNKNKTF